MSLPDRRKMATTQELSDYLGIPVHTLNQWRSRVPKYGPPYLHIGKHVRYPWAGVDKWVAQKLLAAS